MNKKILIIFIVVVLIVAGGAYYFGLQQGGKKGYDQGVKATKAAYEERLTKAVAPTVNPMENLPSANPFEEVKVNPFQGVKVNPFK